MPSNNFAPKGEKLPPDDESEPLNTEARVLAYLRAVMLESGDDPNAMAVAISNVETARARMQRKDPLRVAASAIDLNRLAAKQSS